jgi:hypothetical protein
VFSSFIHAWYPSAPRVGYPGSPIKEKFRKQDEKQLKISSSPSVGLRKVTANFQNTGRNPRMKEATLYYGQDHFWGKLGHGDPSLGANTFDGHVWNVMVDGKVLKSWTITEKDGATPHFTI